MTALSADAIAQKWATGLAGASATITAGVNAVTTAPGLAASRQAAAYQAGVAANVAKWQKNVAGVSLQDWQNATITKGVPRIATGATAAQPAFAQFMSKLLPFQAQLVNTLPPRGNTAQNIQRAVAFMNGMTNFSNS